MNCAVCHGPAATGSMQGPPLVHEIYEPGHHPDELFVRAVMEGVAQHHWDFGPMPRIGGLSEATSRTSPPTSASSSVTPASSRSEARRPGVEAVRAGTR
jgi:hypothetical protein